MVDRLHEQLTIQVQSASNIGANRVELVIGRQGLAGMAAISMPGTKTDARRFQLTVDKIGTRPPMN